MNQTFLAFPSGTAGVALILLRASVAISLIAPPFGNISPHLVPTIGLNLLSFAVAVGDFEIEYFKEIGVNHGNSIFSK